MYSMFSLTKLSADLYQTELNRGLTQNETEITQSIVQRKTELVN